MIRGRLFGVSMLVATATVAGCGSRDDVKSDVAVAPTSGSPLTAAQVQAARNAQLLNGYIRPEFYEAMATFVTGSDDPAASSQAIDINNAGSVAGFTNDSLNLIGGTKSQPFFDDRGGRQILLDIPWPNGLAYLADINEHGDMLGYGGPNVADGNYTTPLVYHPDRSVQMLTLPKPQWATAVRMWASAMNDDAATGLSTIVGTTSAAFAGALAVWHLDNDTVDAVGPSALPTTGVQWTEGHTHRTGSTVNLPGDAAAHFDGNTCVTIPPGTDTQPWSASGLTLMAWVRTDAGLCPGGRRAVVRRSDDWAFGYDVADMSLTCNADGTAALDGHLLAGATTGTTPPAGRIVPGEWTHLAVTSDTFHIRSYVNGNLVAEAPTGGNLRWAPFGLALGCRPNDPSSNFIGAIDEVSMFANALGSDQIRLFSRDQTSYPPAAFAYMIGRYQHGFFDIVLPPGGPGYAPSANVGALSDAGSITATVFFQGAPAAAVYDPATGWKNLNDLVAPDSGWDLQHAGKLNAAGQVVGSGQHDGRHAMFRMDLASGAIVDLGHDTNGIFADPALYILPGGINAAGQVAGTVYDQWPFWPQRAVVFSDESGLTDLNDLLAPEVAAAGWELRQANAINDTGMVVGYAYNQVSGLRRAFRAQLPVLPSTNAIAVAACVGKVDGAACDAPNTCGSNNVCNGGVCGGDLGGICLRADGVVDMGGGNFVAVFGHNSSAATSLHPDTNRVLINGTVITNPHPTPPGWLPPGSHPGSYLPTFVAGQTISWRVNGQLVSVSASSLHLSTVPIGTGGLGTPVDGTTVVIRPDLDRYKNPPADPTAGSEPEVGEPFNGTLTGKLTVGPTGSAIYTLPISIPPGVAGMTPNLSLVYNSQGADGIAGQGWELGGLSLIHRCPRKAMVDGTARSVMMDELVRSDGGPTDGICLDGQRLFEIPGEPGKYRPERTDFSSIQLISNSYFLVVTKSGEIRYYGLDSKARVRLPRGGLDPSAPPSGQETAVWALDKVVDDWGNFYDIHYNGGAEDFVAKGLRVTEIDYTGHVMPDDSTPDVQPFYSVKFGYEDRLDVRWSRFGTSRIPRNGRLKSITTARGTYSLSYSPSQPLLPSELQRVDYCAGDGCTCPGPSCLEPLSFAWTGGNYSWAPSAGYALPAGLPVNVHLRGTQMVDLNGDGRPDLVLARQTGRDEPSEIGTWENTGHGWAFRNLWRVPIKLVDTNEQPIGVRFADVDGDGLVDIIQDHADVDCDGSYCVVCEFDCRTHERVVPAVWLNKLRSGGGTVDNPVAWELDRRFSSQPSPWTSVGFNGPDTLADMNGDGRVDLVRLTESRGMGGSFAILDVLPNSGTGWLPNIHLELPGASVGVQQPFQLQDINRDGLPDVVSRAHYVYGDGHMEASEAILINQGPAGTSGLSFADIVTHMQSAGGTLLNLEHPPSRGDIDGDGTYDTVSYVSLFQLGVNNDLSAYRLGVALADGTGTGFGDQGAGPYRDAIAAVSPVFLQSEAPGDVHAPFDFGFALADINADGLVDLVRNHSERPQNNVPRQYGGQVLINTGTTWQDIHGVTGWHLSAGDTPVPVVPDEDTLHNGSAFVDLDGDGITDLIQEATSDRPSRAWINTFEPPTIAKFPNGLAAQTEVSYVAITSEAARFGVLPAYSDSESLAYGTSYLNLPLRVVSSVVATNGVGGFSTTSYQYADLRGSSFGYGSQGFRTMTVTEPTGVVTKTTFAQAYPYTGLPVLVEKSSQLPAGPLTSTGTSYCVDAEDPFICEQRPMYPRTYAPRTTFFVYPTSIVDTSYLRTSAFPENNPIARIATETRFQFDDRGNAKSTTVTISGAAESYRKETVNSYGSLGSREQRRGKITRAVVTTQKVAPVDGHNDPIVHTTEFEYRVYEPTLAFALFKTKVEPGAGASVELHTVYDYDPFGNVVTTTSCADAFSQCFLGASGPAQMPFRTTTVSYDPHDLGLSAFGLFQLGYGKGRFPVKTTNPVGHPELTVYDPKLGAMLRKTGPNGITTCYGYDPFGLQTSETARCGSNGAITTTTTRHRVVPASVVAFAPDAPSPPPVGPDGHSDIAQVVTVTRPQGGTPTWAFADILGRTIQTLTRGFDGGIVQTVTEYDRLGRIHRASKQSRVSDPQFWTTTEYDTLGRVSTVTQDLAQLDGTQADALTASSLTTITYQGATILTERTVNGENHPRSETKNATGKVERVTDANGVSISFAYDADGNLTDTYDPASNVVHHEYDQRGRKRLTRDPDLGQWTYSYDGFGDLLSQTDAKNQTATIRYDRLGRMIARTDAAGTAEWVYDVAPGAGIGKLAAMVSAPDARLSGACQIPHASLVDGNRSGRSFKYTAFGDVEETAECTDGTVFSTNYQYDFLGRQKRVTYPEVKGTRFAVDYNYTTLGFLQYVADASDGSVYWAATEVNAAGQVTAEYTRNGVETFSDRNPSTGWLLARASNAHADSETLIQNWGYRFDEAGNLRRRVRADRVNAANSAEAFDYDRLDRLTGANSLELSGSQELRSETYGYDSLGNLYKDGKAYSYAGCATGAGPHAVCRVAGSAPFSYDRNGNMVDGNERTVEYNATNKPIHIDSHPAVSRGNDIGTVDFIYGADGQRVVQAVAGPSGPAERTVYVGLGATGKSVYERTTRASGVEHAHFIYAGGAHGGSAFALRVVTDHGSATPEVATKYYHLDHLGSVTAMSDERGHVIDAAWGGADPGVLSYDAWGARRASERQPADPAAFDLPVGRRGFTGHESIPNVGLVNMNGRVYDPELGRFLSPDPNVQLASDLQSYNRYSYALNNPLRYTDPTGYFINGWFDLAVNVAIGVTAIAVCVGTEGAGCAIMFSALATYYNATSAFAAGASFNQVLLTTAIGLAGGALGGAYGSGLTSVLGGGLGAQIAGGAMGGAVAATFTTIALGGSGSDLGRSILFGAASGALTGAVTYAIRGQAPVSVASEEEAQGRGGSGAAALEKAETVESVLADAGYGGVDPVDQFLTDEGYVPGGDPKTRAEIAHTIDFERDARSAYRHFGATAVSVDQLEAQVKADLTGKWGPIHTAGSTSSSGTVEIADQPNPYLRNATKLHEDVHVATVRHGIAVYGEGTPEYDAWLYDPKNWAADEVKAYTAGIRYLQGVLLFMDVH